MNRLLLTVPTFFGTEAIVAHEIRSLGYETTEVTDGRVTFEGDCEAIALANINLRVGERVLIKMAEFKATTFEELFYFINDEIKACGYVNLDFLGNLGHSIVRDKNDRIYIEKGNNKKLSSVEAFTFEPHIGTEKSAYGFKKEDIYTFCNNKLIKL